MNPELHIEVIQFEKLSKCDYAAIADLCSRAYDEDYEPYLRTFDDPVHVLGKLDGKLISHALWITRWLQTENMPIFKTAYVEAVATDKNFRGLGYASAIMQRLAAEIQDFDIGGLCPADTTLYSRLGWELWQGPLFHRKDGVLVPDPDEKMMFLYLSNTPKINIHAPLSIEWREGEVW